MGPSFLFFELHRDLPREGPGDDASTARAIEIVAPYLPGEPSILDIGCGPGAQTLVLARKTGGTITAVDTHGPFLDEMSRRAEAAGLKARIHPLPADMRKLPFAASSFDLIWSEGAIYIIGFREGLRRWKHLLKPGGCMVVSELSWIADDPGQEEYSFWSAAYPAMQREEANRSTIADEGFEVLADFPLPRASWFTEYYDPLERRAHQLIDQYATNPEAKEWITAQLEEIEIARRFSGFAYVMYVMRRL